MIRALSAAVLAACVVAAAAAGTTAPAKDFVFIDSVTESTVKGAYFVTPPGTWQSYEVNVVTVKGRVTLNPLPGDLPNTISIYVEVVDQDGNSLEFDTGYTVNTTISMNYAEGTFNWSAQLTCKSGGFPVDFPEGNWVAIAYLRIGSGGNVGMDYAYFSVYYCD